jgi:hypothetical protein
MSQFLFEYHPVAPTTWVYLSSLVMIGLFFKFNRFWSVRNLDLILLIALAPGLLMVYFGYKTQPATADARPVEVSEQVQSAPVPSPAADVSAGPRGVARWARIKRLGYLWLLSCCGLWLVRLLLDLTLARRPLLAPNLSVGGLAFMGVSLFIFLMANVVSSKTPATATATDQSAEPVRMDQLMAIHQDRGPGYAVLNKLPIGAHKTMAIVAHSAIVLGLILIGYRHFDNVTNGFGAAMLYLMLPYTTQMTGRLDHFLPAALLVWAVLLYRLPTLAGLFVGAACGCIYYPLFLLPLWISFYRQRGWMRFVLGVLAALTIMALGLLATPAGFWGDLKRMFGILSPAMEGLEGIWDLRIGGWDPIYRMPVLAAVFALSFSMALWPVQKNLGTLISCSAAVMVAAQFWIGWDGGLYLAWFLPLTLLTIFRPNLEDRVAQTVLANGWFGRRKSHLPLAA